MKTFLKLGSNHQLKKCCHDTNMSTIIVIISKENCVHSCTTQLLISLFTLCVLLSIFLKNADHVGQTRAHKKRTRIADSLVQLAWMSFVKEE